VKIFTSAVTLTVAASLVCIVPARAHQIAFYLADKGGADLLPGNEAGTVNGTPGSGGEVRPGIVFYDQTRVLTIDVA
jgi:hypothetical protein